MEIHVFESTWIFWSLQNPRGLDFFEIGQSAFLSVAQFGLQSTVLTGDGEGIMWSRCEPAWLFRLHENNLSTIGISVLSASQYYRHLSTIGISVLSAISVLHKDNLSTIGCMLVNASQLYMKDGRIALILWVHSQSVHERCAFFLAMWLLTDTSEFCTTAAINGIVFTNLGSCSDRLFV